MHTPSSLLLATALATLGLACRGGARGREPIAGHAAPGVHVSAPVTRYPITAASLNEMRAQMRRDGPRVSGRAWDGATSWNIRWTYSYRGSGAGCTLADVQVYVTAAVTMPEWRPEQDSDDATRLWWRRYESGLMTHEAGHARLAVEKANAIRRALLGLSRPDCTMLGTDANVLGRRLTDELRAEQARYDAETRHGATQIQASLAADAP